jgi:FkbM family methyltransferase
MAGRPAGPDPLRPMRFLGEVSTGQGALTEWGRPVIKRAAIRVIRTTQSFFPWLLEAKCAVQYALRAASRRPAEIEFAALRDLVPADALCIDIGANRGQSIQALRLVLPRCEIVSFEPNPALYSRLVAHHAGDPRVTMRPEALGEAPSMSTLHVPYYRRFMYDGLASLDEMSARSWISPQTFFLYREGWVSVHSFPVRTITLDSLGLAPNFIKIDTQGTEISVLRGAAETLARSRPVIMCETPDVASVTMLTGLGYVEHRVVAGQLVLGRVPGQNSLFITDR